MYMNFFSYTSWRFNNYQAILGVISDVGDSKSYWLPPEKEDTLFSQLRCKQIKQGDTFLDGFLYTGILKIRENGSPSESWKYWLD